MRIGIIIIILLIDYILLINKIRLQTTINYKFSYSCTPSKQQKQISLSHDTTESFWRSIEKLRLLNIIRFPRRRGYRQVKFEIKLQAFIWYDMTA